MNNSLLASPRARQLYVLAWLIMMALELVILRWYGYQWHLAFTDAVISNALLGMAGWVLVTMFEFYIPAQNRVVYVMTICIALSAIWLSLTRVLVYSFTNDVEARELLGSGSLPLRLFVGVLILACVSLVSVLWRYLMEQREMEQRREEAARELRDAELFKLRQQLQPHFLFNSLNSISALTGVAPEKARTMVQQLSEFLRGTLRKEEHQWISLEEELHHIRLYLEIEQVRFGHRLQTAIEIEEGCEKMKVPALLLQPVLENAIKFGLYDTVGEVMIRLDARVVEKALFIAVSNPFDPETSAPKGTGFGLSSVQRRLALLFSRTDLLVTKAVDGLFITRLIIPQDLYESDNH